MSRNLVPEYAAAAQTRVALAMHSDVELLEVTALDLRCVINANPEVGDTVSFEVQRDGGRVTSVSGLVHWKELRRSRYEVGLYLPAGLPADLSDLATEARRKSNRYRCRQSGLFVRQDTLLRSEAAVVNYSYDGFAIQTETFSTIDEIVSFEWGCERTRQRISGQVMWQIEKEHGVLLGCQTKPGVGYRIAGLQDCRIERLIARSQVRRWLSESLSGR